MENTRDHGWRTLDPYVAEALRRARRACGWSLRRAAREVELSPGYLCLLEGARRRPSVVAAERLVAGYELPSYAASRLRAVALRGVGHDWRGANGLHRKNGTDWSGADVGTPRNGTAR